MRKHSPWGGSWKSVISNIKILKNGASPLEFPKLVLHLLGIPVPISKTHGNSTWFFLGHPCKFLFLAAPGISTFCLEIPCPFFFWNSLFTQLHWLGNILLQKFYTLSKKEILMQKAAFLSLLWTHPIDLWCNMFETLEIQRKYRW